MHFLAFMTLMEVDPLITKSSLVVSSEDHLLQEAQVLLEAETQRFLLRS